MLEVLEERGHLGDPLETRIGHLHRHLDRACPRLHIDRRRVRLVVGAGDPQLSEPLRGLDLRGRRASHHAVDLDHEVGRLKAIAAGGDHPLALVVLHDLGDREVARACGDLERQAHERVGRCERRLLAALPHRRGHLSGARPDQVGDDIAVDGELRGLPHRVVRACNARSDGAPLGAAEDAVGRVEAVALDIRHDAARGIVHASAIDGERGDRGDQDIVGAHRLGEAERGGVVGQNPVEILLGIDLHRAGVRAILRELRDGVDDILAAHRGEAGAVELAHEVVLERHHAVVVDALLAVANKDRRRVARRIRTSVAVSRGLRCGRGGRCLNRRNRGAIVRLASRATQRRGCVARILRQQGHEHLRGVGSIAA